MKYKFIINSRTGNGTGIRDIAEMQEYFTNAIGSFIQAKRLSHIRSLKITTLFIAHRLSTFKLCDRILVLSDGQIVQEGSHETLSKTPGPYQKLLEYEIQTKL